MTVLFPQVRHPVVVLKLVDVTEFISLWDSVHIVLTDTSSLSFGRVYEGPQHFTDIRRNVAIVRTMILQCGRAKRALRCGGIAARSCSERSPAPNSGGIAEFSPSA